MIVVLQGSSISFGYASTPPDQKKTGKLSTNITTGQAEAVSRPTGQTLQERELRRSSGSDVDQETKTLLESERKRVSMLETTLVTKETELGKVRLDLASSQSLLEQTQKDLKVSATECSRRESELAKVQLELQTNTNKVSDHFSSPPASFEIFRCLSWRQRCQSWSRITSVRFRTLKLPRPVSS